MQRIALLAVVLTAPLLLASTCAEQLLRPRIELTQLGLVTLSPDGSVAGGAGGFWREGAEIQLPGAPTFVTGISNGAHVVVGSTPQSMFVRWEDGVATALPAVTNQGEVEDVSADGLVAVGYVYGPPGTGVDGAMWIDGEEIPLTGPGGFEADLAQAVSEDGETVLVFGGFPGGGNGRYLWHASGDVTEIPTHPDVEMHRAAVDCLSDDGTTVVFTDLFELHPVYGRVSRSFRWREGALEELADPEVFPSVDVYGVTRNGEVAVGSAFGGSFSGAMIWDATHGMRSLEALLLELGVAFPAGFHPREAFDIAADGRRIVGNADFPHYGTSWVVTLPPACADHLDNDGDGSTDWPEDPGCGLRLDLSELE